MEKLIVKGGHSLKGEYQVSGAKNAALKMLLASLLTQEKVVVKNVPQLVETESIIEILHFLGASAEWTGPQQVTVEATDISDCGFPTEMASRCRTSFVALGALIGRVNEAVVPLPGKGSPEARPVNWHIQALESIGVSITQDEGFLHARGRAQGGTIRFPKNTHTGTENVILAAVTAEGKVIIKNAAQEPEVDELIGMLNSMGARIKRVDEREIHIEGVESLSGVTTAVQGDRIEAVTAAVAAGLTHGDLTIKGAKTEHITSALLKLEEIGIRFKVQDDQLRVWADPETKLNPVAIESHPFPNFMSDWLPVFVTLLTQADGQSTVHEAVYPSRFSFIGELKNMNAEIQLFNPKIANPEEFYNFELDQVEPDTPHGLKIFGPTPLVGTKIEISSPRTGAALLLAALSAKGTTEISDARQLARSYENLSSKLNTVGASIAKESSEKKPGDS